MNTIMAVQINGRLANAPSVQEVLTKFGCNIETRVGFHEVSKDKCSTDGIVILQLIGSDDEIQALFGALDKIEGVKPKIIEF